MSLMNVTDSTDLTAAVSSQGPRPELTSNFEHQQELLRSRRQLERERRS